MSYLVSTRAPRYSLLFALPLLAAYEGLAWALGQRGQAGVRSGADVLLKSLFVGLGGRQGLAVFTLLLLGGAAFLVGRDIRRNGAPQLRVFAGMAAESVGYGLSLGLVAGTLTQLLLRGGTNLALASGTGPERFDLATQVMISLGAGIYEELLFRVLLVAGLAALGRLVFGWRPTVAGVFAAVGGALIFSAFHYLGPFGDPFQAGSFTFRAVAGLLFSGLYLTRGFGVTAWSHALYDIFLDLA